MQARLRSSVKWTNLPQEVTDQIRDLFVQNFQVQLKGAKIFVEGRIYKEEILLRVGYLEQGRLMQVNFEVSMDYKLTKEDSALVTLGTCVDAAGSLMAEYFEAEGELELPLSWAEYPFDGKKVWLQHSTTNTDLEKQANDLLGEDEESLIQGETDEADDILEEDAEEFEATDRDDEAEDDTSDDEDSDDDDGPKGPLH